MRIETEVLVVGAGVAGLAVALQLGRQGHAVLLVDKAAAPRDKVCGEGLMPLGLDVLQRMQIPLGALDGAAVEGSDFDGLDFHTPRHRATLRFRPGRMGRGVRRTALIQVLERAALAQPGVRLVSDHVLGPLWSDGAIRGVRTAQHEYQAQVVVAADGANSTLARQCAAPRTFGYRMALRRHYWLPQPLPRVQVGLLPGRDLYLTPVGAGCVLATTLTDHAGYRRIAPAYEAMLEQTPFAPWFRGAEPASELLGWYHPLTVPRDYAPGGMLLAGDSSGGIDPCLGMGISMALVAAEAAAEAAGRMLLAPPQRALALERYRTHRRNLFRHYHAFGRLFRLLAGSEQGAAILVRAMARAPRMAERLLWIVAEAQPWTSLLRGNGLGHPAAAISRRSAPPWTSSRQSEFPQATTELGDD